MSRLRWILLQKNHFDWENGPFVNYYNRILYLLPLAISKSRLAFVNIFFARTSEALLRFFIFQESANWSTSNLHTRSMIIYTITQHQIVVVNNEETNSCELPNLTPNTFASRAWEPKYNFHLLQLRLANSPLEYLRYGA